MLRRNRLIPFYLLVLGACGGGGGSEPDDAGSTVDSSTPDAFVPDAATPDAFVPDMGIELDPESYRTAYVEMLCRTWFECLNRHTARYEDYLGGFTDAEECASSSRAQLLARLDLPWPESSTDGHVAFDPERAAECLESEEAYFCDETIIRPVANPCDQVFEGLRESGETCREGECVDGFSCATGGSCDGTCIQVMAVCPACEADEYCQGVSGTCVPRLAAGEACSFDRMCADGLICDSPTIGTGECVVTASLAAGESCEVHDACEAGLICESNQCTAYSIETAGESCGGLSVCEPHLFCFDTSSECEAPHAAGEACVNPTGDCAADLYCDGSTNTCVAQKANGESCGSNYECLTFACFSGACAPFPICELP